MKKNRHTNSIDTTIVTNDILIPSSFQNSMNPTINSTSTSELPSSTTTTTIASSTTTYLLSSPVSNRTLTPSRTIASTSKAWVSPFTNWMSFTPESQSKYSMADLSPHSIFSSPWINQSELPSPPPTKGKDHLNGSLFSPSLFSPFNKSMNPLKLDKFTLDSEDQDSLLLVGESFDNELETKSPRREEFNGVGGGGGVPFHSVVSALDMEEKTSSRTKPKNPSQGRRSGGGAGAGGVGAGSGSGNQQQDTKPNIQKAQGNRAPKHPTLLPKDNIPLVEKISVSNLIPIPPIPFSSPATTAKPKQSTMSPDMNRGHCNCKKSRCLKLYCECFSALQYCSGCNCQDCNNCQEFNSVRQEAIQQTKERNPSAFQLKVTVNQGHMAGCHCKKSRCLKKYCECFEGSVYCGPNCKCMDCQNISGSEALKSVKSNLQRKERANKTELSDSEGDTNHKSESLLLSPCANSDNMSSTPYKDRSKQFLQLVSPDILLSNAIDIHSTPLIKSAQRDSNKSSNHKNKLKSEISESPLSSVSESPDHHILKKRRVESTPYEPVYPFFGTTHPPITKLTALSCLEYLDGPSLYSMSCVNRLWNQAVMDEALWE